MASTPRTHIRTSTPARKNDRRTGGARAGKPTLARMGEEMWALVYDSEKDRWDKTRGFRKERVAKQVHFYLMELVAEGAPCDGELERVFWCPLGEAEARLSFGTERDILARARALLEG